jgi:hypothetical protein
MYTRQTRRARQVGPRGTLIAPKALAPQALQGLAAALPKGGQTAVGSESRVPVTVPDSVWPGGAALAGSPGRLGRAAEAAIYIPRSNLRVRSCEGEGRSKTGASSDPCGWRKAPAAKQLGA